MLFQRLPGSRCAAVLLLSCVACSGDKTITAQPQAIHPTIEDGRVEANANNAISATFKAQVTNATKVRVTYALGSGAGESTPDFTVTSRAVSVPVLGLRPQSDYTLQLTAVSADGTTAESNPIQFRTGALPSNLPTFAVDERASGQPGYTMVALLQNLFSGSGSTTDEPPTRPIAGPIIVDHTGRIVWYRQPYDGPITDWQKQPDGTYTAAVNGVEQGELGYVDTFYVQLDNVGNELRRYFALGQWPTDNHELRLLPNGDVLIMSINSRLMDLTAWGGGESVAVLGNILERISPSGQLVFLWNALDRLDVGTADPLIFQTLPGRATFDFTHGNSIDYIPEDGSYLLGMRNVSQVIKVTANGSIAWKLGGVDSDFQFVNDPLNGFSLQHGGRLLPNGNILVFDNGNGHGPPQSRAVEYRLDLVAKTATLVWQYNAEPHLFGPFMGYAQRLENGNTLITYGATAVVREVNSAGQLVWELRSSERDGIYRAIRIPSLY